MTSSSTSGITAKHSYEFRSGTFSDPIFYFADGTSGTATGANTTTATGTTGKLSWNATDGLTTPVNGALVVPAFEFGGQVSFEVVFKFNELGEFNRIFGFGSANEANMVVLARNRNNNSLQWHTSSSNTPNGNAGRNIVTTPTNSVFTPGATDFVHVVVTHDSTSSDEIIKTIYVNGNPQVLTTQERGIRPLPLISSTKSVHWIGRDGFGDTGSETTKYLKYYDFILTENQVRTLYNDYILSTVTATGAPLKIIPNINLINLN